MNYVARPVETLTRSDSLRKGDDDFADVESVTVLDSGIVVVVADGRQTTWTKGEIVQVVDWDYCSDCGDRFSSFHHCPGQPGDDGCAGCGA
jgi:hypothetical protein